MKLKLIVFLLLLPAGTLTALQTEARRQVSSDEAVALVTKALEVSRANKLPGFAVEEPKKNASAEFFFLEATWDNPQGSVVIGHYAVNRITADVWDGVVCEELKSVGLKKLQQTIRKRLDLSEQAYMKLKKPGPMC